jgi:7,8-dihydroneopterin aldolase/epimerase/oxygenase
VIVELHGLEVRGTHGLLEREREGTTFLFDVELEVGERGRSDRIDDAVDYRAVAARVQEVSDARRYDLLEALAAAVAEALVGSFAVERARVRVRKPHVRELGVPAEFAAATAEATSGQ